MLSLLSVRAFVRFYVSSFEVFSAALMRFEQASCSSQSVEPSKFAAQALAVATYLENGLPQVDKEDVENALMLLHRPAAKA